MSDATSRKDAPAGGTTLRTAALSGRKPTRFRYAPDPAARAALSRALGLSDLPALSLTGEIRPVGKGDFRLEARLSARAVQPCSITLAPVPAAVDEDILRIYLADYAAPEAEEAEIRADDDSEPLPETIDLADLAGEALMLALPLYPRAPGAGLGSMVFAPPGAEPLTDEALKPFAGLSGLAGALKKTPPGTVDEG